MSRLQQLIVQLLRATERFTKTDMVYLAKSGFWINLGSITVSGFSFILYLAFARFLPREVYGTYQYLLSVSAIVGAFTLTGMNSAVTRAVAQGNEGTLSKAIRTQLIWGLLPLLGAWAVGGYYFLHHNQLLGYGFLLIGVFVPFNNALNTYGALVGGRKDFRSGFFFNLLTNSLYYPALIITAFFSKFALALLAANLVSNAIALIICYYLSLRIYKPNKKVDTDTVSYGQHLSVMGVFGTIAGQIDAVLAFHLLGADPLAIYSFATALPDRIASLVKFIPSAALPKLSLLSPPEIRASLRPRIGVAVLASAIIAGVYALCAHLFYQIFFPQYVSAVPYSMLYALAIIPSIAGIFSTALVAQRSIRSLYIFNAILPTVQIILMVAGILWLGLWGLILARIITYTVQFLLGAFLLFMDNTSKHPPEGVALSA